MMCRRYHKIFIDIYKDTSRRCRFIQMTMQLTCHSNKPKLLKRTVVEKEDVDSQANIGNRRRTAFSGDEPALRISVFSGAGDESSAQCSQGINRRHGTLGAAVPVSCLSVGRCQEFGHVHDGRSLRHFYLASCSQRLARARELVCQMLILGAVGRKIVMAD